MYTDVTLIKNIQDENTISKADPNPLETAHTAFGSIPGSSHHTERGDGGINHSKLSIDESKF
jgi:hypothetical protein